MNLLLPSENPADGQIAVAVHAVVGYFRSSGYFALQPYLRNIKEIKILVGINADQMFAEAQRKGLLFFF